MLDVPKAGGEDEADQKGAWFDRVLGLLQAVASGVIAVRIATLDGLPMGFRVFFLTGLTLSTLWGVERIVNRYWTHDIALRIWDRLRSRR